MNTLSNDPTETAAVLHGILAGPIAPTVDQRAAMDVPTLVIGHRVDHVHPFHDAEQLARRLPQGRLIQANSVIELRMHPERLTAEIGQFLDDVWELLAPPTWTDQGRLTCTPRSGTSGPGGSGTSLVGGPAGRVALPFGETALLLQPALFGPPRRSGGTAGLLDMKGIGHPGTEPLHGQLPVPQLGALVVDGDPDLGSQALEEPGPLPRPEATGNRPRRSGARPGCSPCWHAVHRDPRWA